MATIKYNKHRNLKHKIIELRSLGYSYSKIVDILHCSKSTVCYWCGTDQFNKNKIRKSRILHWKLRLIKNITSFKHAVKSNKSHILCKDWNMKLRIAVCCFCKKGNMKNWGYKEVLNKFGTKTHCYLTGREIDLTKDDYCLDHIVPVSKGGQGDIDNLGITIPIANYSKHNMTLEEYLDLCEEVLRYHGRIK